MTDELDPTPAVPSPTAARKLEAIREATVQQMANRMGALVEENLALRTMNAVLMAEVETLRASAEKRRR